MLEYIGCFHALSKIGITPVKTRNFNFMNNLTKFIYASLLTTMAFGLVGCAAGAATSAYSLKAQSADSLTSAAEQKIVDRIKREMILESQPCR